MGKGFDPWGEDGVVHGRGLGMESAQFLDDCRVRGLVDSLGKETLYGFDCCPFAHERSCPLDCRWVQQVRIAACLFCRSGFNDETIPGLFPNEFIP